MSNSSAAWTAHQVGSPHVDVGPRDRELDPLVLADRPVEDHSALGVVRRPLDEPVAVADTFGGDQDALGVHAVENVAEATSLLADQVLCWDLQVVEEEGVGVVIHHGVDRMHFESVARRASRRSTRKTERPSDLRCTWSRGVVRASRIIRSECGTREMKTFWPRIT